MKTSTSKHFFALLLILIFHACFFQKINSLKIAILGGTGRTGKIFISKALQAGHKVSALVRSPTSSTLSDLSNGKKGLNIVQGVIEDQDAMDSVIKGCDVVVSALGGYSNFGPMPSEIGVKNSLKAMKKYGVKKIVVLTAVGTYSKFCPNPFFNVIFNFFLGNFMKDHIKAESLLQEEKDIQWTTLHPPYIVPFAESVGYEIGVDELIPNDTHMIPYPDVAQCLLDVTLSNDKTFLNKKLHVSSSKPFVRVPGVNHYPDFPRILWEAVSKKFIFNPFFIVGVALLILLSIYSRRQQSKKKST